MFSTAFQANAFQNDAFQIVITPTNVKNGGDDAFYTKEELKRLKGIQKKLRQLWTQCHTMYSLKYSHIYAWEIDV